MFLGPVFLHLVRACCWIILLRKEIATSTAWMVRLMFIYEECHCDALLQYLIRIPFAPRPQQLLECCYPLCPDLKKLRVFYYHYYYAGFLFFFPAKGLLLYSWKRFCWILYNTYINCWHCPIASIDSKNVTLQIFPAGRRASIYELKMWLTSVSYTLMGHANLICLNHAMLKLKEEIAMCSDFWTWLNKTLSWIHQHWLNGNQVFQLMEGL